MQKFMATCWVENMTKAKSCSDQSHHSVLVTVFHQNAAEGGNFTKTSEDWIIELEDHLATGPPKTG